MAKRIKWTDEAIAAEAAKYTTRRAFEKGSQAAYQAARRRGILDQVCAGMTAQRVSWTEELLFAEAAKYTTRKAFEKGSRAAYSAAQKRGILDQVCADMESGYCSTDNDVVYIWRAVGETFEGLPVYKIGITSERLGQQRIKLVAAKAGFRSNLIRWTPLNGKATELEGMLLEMGKNPGYEGIDGATEFRALTDLELEVAIDTIDFCATSEQ